MYLASPASPSLPDRKTLALGPTTSLQTEPGLGSLKDEWMDDDIRQHLDAGRRREAFGLLVDRYQDKVFHLALSLVRDRTVAEDMAQEVFMKIWKGLAGYSGAASLSTWIYAVGRNTCLTELNRRALRPKVLTGESVTDPIADPLAAGCDMEARLDAKVLLARLPERYRQAMVLYYLEERSYQEVAAMLGVPMGTVKTFLHRAKKMLVELGEPRETRCAGKGDAHGLS
jgi:RNA polymerase sigma-70 factor (ECF subfamily)